MNEKPDNGKHEKDASQSYREIEEEQIFMNKLKKEMKKEILNEVFILLALYVFFTDL